MFDSSPVLCDHAASKTWRRVQYLRIFGRVLHGLPVPVVRYTDHPNAIPMRRHASGAAEALFGAMGAVRVVHYPVNMATHNLGTCRMSLDEADGVCDKWGRVHEVDNLYVSDGSLFPSSGSANPTLTIVALAMRQAEHIRSRMTAGEL